MWQVFNIKNVKCGFCLISTKPASVLTWNDDKKLKTPKIYISNSWSIVEYNILGFSVLCLRKCGVSDFFLFYYIIFQ